MLFNFSHGSFATVFGISVYGKYHDSWWHKITVWPLYRVGRSIRDAIWWVRYRIDPEHKYHLIDTRLKPGYYDIDGLMLNGMFSLLRRYVEEEHEGVEELEKWGRELIDRAPDGFTKESDERQGNKELEAVALWRWWMETRPAMLDRQDELMELLYGGESLFVSEPVEMENGEKLYEMKRRHEETEQEAEWFKELRDLEIRIYEEETEMLKRLVDIRGGLWT
jgi:hypothetical protein